MTMTADELLAKVKAGLGITGDYQDETLKVYIDEVKAFMQSAGVPETVANSSEAVGLIMRGVADLWTYESGKGTFSPHFIQRMIQLSTKKKEGGDNAETDES